MIGEITIVCFSLDTAWEVLKRLDYCSLKPAWCGTDFPSGYDGWVEYFKDFVSFSIEPSEKHDKAILSYCCNKDWFIEEYMEDLKPNDKIIYFR